MKSRFLLQAVVLLAAVSLLASCGGGDALTTPTATPSTPVTTPTATPSTPVTTVEELKAKLDAGANIAIVDTRSTKNYEISHIAGAISIPLLDLLDDDDNALATEEILRQYGYLNDYDEIITY